MPSSIQLFLTSLQTFLPTLLAGIIILVIGWLVALLISRLVGSLLHRTSLDNRIASSLQGGTPEKVPVEKGISTAVFWLIMLFVIVIFLQTINLGNINVPLNAMLLEFVAFIPNLLAAIALALVAWLVATVLRMIITRVFNATGLSRRLTDQAQMNAENQTTIGQTIGNVVYWLVFLLFLPAILGALNLQGILVPIQNMVNGILAALPNILGAALVLVLGYFIARIIRQIVANLFDGMGVNRLTQRAGVSGTLQQQRLSDILATVVFVLILIPVIIAALNVLNIPAISGPASIMLTSFLNALPAIFGAALILVVAYFIARLVGNLVSTLLAGVGFNRLMGGIIPEGTPVSFSSMPAESPIPATGAAAGAIQPSRTTPAQIVGTIVMIAILLFAALQAAQVIGFAALAVLIGQFIVTAANILFGLVIFAIGLYLANLAFRMISGTGVSQASILATAARITIIIFSGALALRQMGIAQDIVNLAFGLLLGAVAVAAAIAFGLGGRNVAGQLLERWRSDLNIESTASLPPRAAPNPRPQSPETGDD